MLDLIYDSGFKILVSRFWLQDSAHTAAICLYFSLFGSAYLGVFQVIHASSEQSQGSPMPKTAQGNMLLASCTTSTGKKVTF